MTWWIPKCRCSRKTSHEGRPLLGAVGAGIGALCVDGPGWWACMMVSHGARARGPPQLPGRRNPERQRPLRELDAGAVSVEVEGRWVRVPPARCRPSMPAPTLSLSPEGPPSLLATLWNGKMRCMHGCQGTQATCVDWRKSGVESLRHTPARTARG